MIHKLPFWALLAVTLLLCSCKSRERIVEISLYENNYVTGSFVRPTTPDKVRVYTDNAPLPLTTEVIGDFGVADPISPHKASLDVLLDTVKKEVSYLGGNGIFLTRHIKPLRGIPGCHVLNGYILLQPDTILKPNREHPLNTAYREHLEKEEAERLAQEKAFARILPPHKFRISAGHATTSHDKDATPTDIERTLESGLGIQASYTHDTWGLLYNGYFAKGSGRFHSAPPTGISYQAFKTHHSIIPAIVVGGDTRMSKRFFWYYYIGFGYQWDTLYLFTENSQIKHTTGHPVTHLSLECEYRIGEHWGVAAKFHSNTWTQPINEAHTSKKRASYNDIVISFGVNFHL